MKVLPVSKIHPNPPLQREESRVASLSPLSKGGRGDFFPEYLKEYEYPLIRIDSRMPPQYSPSITSVTDKRG